MHFFVRNFKIIIKPAHELPKKIKREKRRRKLHAEELHNLYSPDILRVFKSVMRWVMDLNVARRGNGKGMH